MEPNSEQVVSWFTLSLIIAGIAKGLNRSSLFWWLLGIIFGPIALLILVLLGKYERDQIDQANQIKQ